VNLRVLLAGAAAALLTTAGLAHAQSRLEPVESCVSDGVIAPAPDDAQTLLDPADRVQVGMAMLAQYPVLLRSGFAPTQILLWKRQDGEVLYVSLQTHPDKPGALCFTATFAAEAFDFTPLLLQKYFAADGDLLSV